MAVEVAELDSPPGGRCAVIRRGPAGERQGMDGVFLDVKPGGASYLPMHSQSAGLRNRRSCWDISDSRPRILERVTGRGHYIGFKLHIGSISNGLRARMDQRHQAADRSRRGELLSTRDSVNSVLEHQKRPLSMRSVESGDAEFDSQFRLGPCCTNCTRGQRRDAGLRNVIVLG